MAKILPRSAYQTSATIEELEITKRTTVLRENVNLLLKSIPDAYTLYEKDYHKFRTYLNKTLLQFDKLLVKAVEMKKNLLDLDGEDLDLSPNVNFPIGYLNDTHKNSFLQKNIVGRYQAIYYNLIYRTYELGLKLVNKAIGEFLKNMDEVAVEEIYYNFNVYRDSGASDPREKMLSRTNIINFNWFAIEIIQDFVFNEYDKDNILQIFKVDDRKGLRNQFLKGNPITEILLYHRNYGGLFVTDLGNNVPNTDRLTNSSVYKFLTKGNFNFLSKFSVIKSYKDIEKEDVSYLKNEVKTPNQNKPVPINNRESKPLVTEDGRLLFAGNISLLEYDFNNDSIKELLETQIPGEKIIAYIQKNNIWIA